MSKNLIIIIVVAFIAVLIAVAFFVSVSTKSTSDSVSSGLESSNNIEQSSPYDTPVTQENLLSRYVEYSPEVFENSKDQKRVYFFHASWCPTCKAANREFSENSHGIPGDVVLFKTDYDTQTELKKKYGITYQHTFVQVDESGNEIAKWNGGGLEELSANLK